MSTPTASARPAINPELGLMFVAAAHLIPLFEEGPVDQELARLMAFSAMDAYVPHSNADYVNAARTIAFSMAALALLSRITREPMPLPEQLQAYARASTLNSSADTSERTMILRRRSQKTKRQADSPAKQPDPAPQATEADLAEVKTVVNEALKHTRAAGYAAAGTPAQRLSAALEAAMRTNIPGFTPAAPKTPSPRQDLLRNTAINRTAGQNQPPFPS